MKLAAAQLNNFFNRGKVIVPAKPYDYKLHLSLCIHRTIQNSVIDSLLKSMFIKNPKVTVSARAGDAMIDRARCIEASDFYRNTDADVMMFVDDDIKFDPEDLIKVANLAFQKKSVACATYVVKRENYCWITCKPLENSPPIVFSPTSEPVEVKWAATGFVAIHRNVLTDLIHELKLPLCHPTDLKFWPFFQPMIWKHPSGDHLYLSEDWAMSERASSLGHKIWLDPSVRLTHYGVYGYTLDDMCRAPREYCETIRYEDYKDQTLPPRHDGSQLDLSEPIQKSQNGNGA